MHPSVGPLTDPATQVVAKATVTAVLAGLVGAQFAPLMVTWGGAFFGACLGAAICLSYAGAMTLGPATRLWALAFSFGMAGVWTAEYVLGLLGAEAFLNGKEEIRPLLTALVAFYWRQVVTGVPIVLKFILRLRSGTGGPP